MAELIDGKVISKQIKDELKEQVATLKKQGKEIGFLLVADIHRGSRVITYL